jgi:hypothetical protein
MNQPILTYGMQRSIENVRYNLERKLPAKGKVFAKLGDIVKPETVIAEGKISSGYRVFRLGELLRVPPQKAHQYMHRVVGSRVFAGDVIAEAPKIFSLRNVQFLAPVDGILHQFDSETGLLTFEFAPATIRLPAGISGKISQISIDEGVSIETMASLVFGAFATGQPREGALRLIAAVDEPVPLSAIGSHLAGHVVAGGSFISKSAINHCLAVGVKGIIVGGISAHDLLEISNKFNTHEDIGLTILVTSGIGDVPMEKETYRFLERYQEQQVFMIPQQKMMIAPSLHPHAAVKTVSELPAGFLPLVVGATVRILGGNQLGEVAKVAKILPVQQIPGSRMALTYCLLELMGGDKIELPVTAVEIIAS